MELAKFKQKQREFYDSIGSRPCPALNATVHFTASGFYHLINSSKRSGYQSHPRKPAEQILKLKCLSHAPEVVMKSTIIAETRTSFKIIHGVKKQVTYYELAHIIKTGEDLRVIIERIGNGNYKFLSIMPHKKRDKNKKRPGGRS